MIKELLFGIRFYLGKHASHSFPSATLPISIASSESVELVR